MAKMTLSVTLPITLEITDDHGVAVMEVGPILDVVVPALEKELGAHTELVAGVAVAEHGSLLVIELEQPSPEQRKVIQMVAKGQKYIQ